MLDIEKIRELWKYRGFSCDIWQDPPGQYWHDYTHDKDELLLLLEGEMEIELDGRIIHPAIGEEVLVRSGVKHSVRNTGTTQNRWLYGYGE